MASMDVALMKFSEALENLMVIGDVLVKKKKKKSPPTCRRVEKKSPSDARNRHANNSINPQRKNIQHIHQCC